MWGIKAEDWMKTLGKRVKFPGLLLRKVLKGTNFSLEGDKEKVESKNEVEKSLENLDKIYGKPRRLER